MPYSLTITVRNEAGSVSRLLDSIAAQTLPPDEVVIADGGSTDGTQEVITSYAGRLPLRLLALPGANISQGRNAAIRNASHDMVLVTDAGVRLEPRWAEALVAAMEGGADVACGFFLADPHTPFEMAMGATVLPAVEDVNQDTFLPSSRSVGFRKQAWEAAGGYPEWLDYCEDLVFDLRLKEIGCRFVFVPDAVAHFRPRSNLRAFYLQYYRYARGDGKADLWRKRHAIRYTTYALGPALAVWGWRHNRSWGGKAAWALLALGAAAYCRRPVMRLLPMLASMPAGAKLYALAMVPVIRLAGDVAKMAGYPVGVVWRLRRGRGSWGEESH